MVTSTFFGEPECADGSSGMSSMPPNPYRGNFLVKGMNRLSTEPSALVIIGAVLLLKRMREAVKLRCRSMAVDPDFGGLQGGKTVRIVGRRASGSTSDTPSISGDSDRLRSPSRTTGHLLAVTPRRFDPGKGRRDDPRGQRRLLRARTKVSNTSIRRAVCSRLLDSPQARAAPKLRIRRLRLRRPRRQGRADRPPSEQTSPTSHWAVRVQGSSSCLGVMLSTAAQHYPDEDISHSARRVTPLRR